MKTKYDWSSIPVAYKYLSTDSDGKVFAHTEKPPTPNFICFPIGGSSKRVYCKPFNGNWQDSLEERPK